MAGTITFGGIGSGIDTESIVTGLVNASSGQLNAYKSGASDTHAAVSSLSDIATLLGNLKTATDALTGLGDASSYTASVVGDGVVASANGAAQPGSFSVQVLGLAQEHRSYSNTFASPSDALGQTGTLQLGVGTATPASIDVTASDSLQTIADKINSAGIRATASVFYDGTNYRLQLRGMDTGAANAVSIAETGTTLGLADPANLFQSAADASVKIDGFTVTRPTNQIVGAIQGVTLAVTAKTTTAATLTVAPDPQTLGGKLTSVVNAYNAVIAQVHTLAGYGTTAGTSPVLNGDTTLRSITSRMSDAMLTVVAGAAQNNTLGSIGLSLNEDGTIALDQTKLSSAMAADPANVAAVLAGVGGGSGAMDVMSSLMDSFTQPASGMLTMEQQALGDQATSLDDSATQENTRLQAYAAQLRTQFTNMDTIVAGNNSTLSYLTKLYG